MGFDASNSAEKEWWAKAAPVKSKPATIEAAIVRTFMLRSSKSNRGETNAALRAIVLTEIYRQIFPADPAQLPAARPWLRVRARVVDRDLITQRVVVGACEALDERQLIGVRQAAVREPEIFVEARRPHDQRV